MIVASKTNATTLGPILERLRREHFPGSRFSEAGSGMAIAHDRDHRLGSAFQPIVRASDGSIIGHQALLRAADERGHALPPAELFHEACDEDGLAHLDRLARTLHAVNYFGSARNRSPLFVAIDPKLVPSAPDDHQRFFDALLSLLDVPTSRVVVMMPGAALEEPASFVRATISYVIRGYRVLADLRPGDALAEMEHVLLAGPHYVAIDAAELPTAQTRDLPSARRLRSMLAALRSRRIQTLARRIETQAQADAAREAGFTLLQGRGVLGEARRPGP